MIWIAFRGEAARCFFRTGKLASRVKRDASNGYLYSFSVIFVFDRMFEERNGIKKTDEVAVDFLRVGIAYPNGYKKSIFTPFLILKNRSPFGNAFECFNVAVSGNFVLARLVQGNDERFRCALFEFCSP